MPLEHDIAAAFDLGGRIRDVRPHGHGLINDTFVVTLDSGRHVILQRINRRVFPRPELVMQNLRTLVGHVYPRQRKAGSATRELRLPAMFAGHDGKDFVLDKEGGFWRAISFVENTRALEIVTSTAQAEEVGFALGRFHALVHDLDPARLHETLPGFHNAPNYYARFAQASARPRRASDSAELRECLSFAQARKELVPVLETARREGKLAIRPIHGDTKLNNFLFDIDSGQAVSLIDLDTVQPGLIHYDIGDCLRSCANPAGESPADIGAVCFNLDIGRAILKQYFVETGGFLTPADYGYMYDAVRLIPLELGLRFVTDHLEGNHYFKTDRPGQNLHRARAQFALTASIEQDEDRIRALIAELRKA